MYVCLKEGTGVNLRKRRTEKGTHDTEKDTEKDPEKDPEQPKSSRSKYVQYVFCIQKALLYLLPRGKGKGSFFILMSHFSNT